MQIFLHRLNPYLSLKFHSSEAFVTNTDQQERKFKNEKQIF